MYRIDENKEEEKKSLVHKAGRSTAIQPKRGGGKRADKREIQREADNAVLREVIEE